MADTFARQQAIRESASPGPLVERPHGYVTVGRLRDWLASFEDDAVVVVRAGIGFEEPRLGLAEVRPVTVPQRYRHEVEGGETVVALVGVHGG